MVLRVVLFVLAVVMTSVTVHANVICNILFPVFSQICYPNKGDKYDKGVISRDGWAIIDESDRHLFSENDSDWGAWVSPRPDGTSQNLYIFAYGHDYKAALSDYTKIAGKILVPFCAESALSTDVVDVHHYACPAINAFEGKMINVLGEYGGLGMAIDGHLWQATDVEGEVNGIMTYDREVIKMDELQLKIINRSVIESLEQ